MPDVIFNWPGGKSHLSDWVLSNTPQHECYVEVFGGSAALLLNKPKSNIEIYNDLDEDLVQFFRVYREKHDELIDWLEGVPYARDTYEKWATMYYSDGERFDDPVKRAGVFFALRYMQFGSKYSSKSGFGTSKVQNQAQTFKNKVENLKNFTERFDGVTIENDDWSDIIDRYDGEDTFFYCDPPYVGTENYYIESDFTHEEFITTLSQIDGYVAISYDSIPESMDEDEWWIQSKESKNYIDSGVKGETKETTELLITNYDPDEVDKFHSADQSSISQISSQDNQNNTSNTGDFLGTIEDNDENGVGDSSVGADDSGASEDDDADGFLENVTLN